MASPRRDHLVDTALKLFCQNGFRATGIDKVLAESGVAKKTLYNHFRSKDELVVAALKQRDEEFLRMVKEAVPRLVADQGGDERLARALAFFDVLDEWFHAPDFNGCTFINASAEYPRQDDPVHVACAEHKRLVIQVVEELLAGLPLADTHLVARQLAVLADGAIVNAHTAGDLEAAALAKTAARQLLEGYLA